MSHAQVPQQPIVPKPQPLLPAAQTHPALPPAPIEAPLQPVKNVPALPPGKTPLALPPGKTPLALPPGKTPLALPPGKTPLALPPGKDTGSQVSEAFGKAAAQVHPEHAKAIGQDAAQATKAQGKGKTDVPPIENAVKNAQPSAQQQIVKGAVEHAKTADTPGQKSQAIGDAANAAVESQNPKAALAEVAKTAANEPGLQTTDSSHQAPDAAHRTADGAGNHPKIGQSILGRFLGGVNLYGDITSASSKFKDGMENNNPTSTAAGFLNVAKGVLDLGSMGDKEAQILTTNLGPLGGKAWDFLSKTTVSQAANSFVDLGKQGMSTLGSTLTKPIGFDDMAKGASSMWKSGSSALNSTLDATGSFAKEGGSQFLNEIGYSKNATSPFMDTLGHAFQYAKNTSVGDAVGDAGRGFSSLWHGGVDMATDLIKTGKQGLGSAWNFANKPLHVGEMWNGAKSGAGSLFNTAKTEVGSFGKIADSGKFGTAANVLGGVLTSVDQFGNSNAETTAGKSASAGAAGVTNFLFNQGLPVTAVVDSLLSLGLGQINEKNEDGSINHSRNGVKNTSISNSLNKSIDTVTTLAEGIVTGETGGMEKTHQSLKQGDGGILLQMATAAGDSAQTWNDPAAMADFAEATQRGDYGVVGQFGSALGEGFGDLGGVVNFYKDAAASWFHR